MVWYSHLSENFPQSVVIHTVKGFRIVNEAELNVFMEFSFFYYDPTDVGNLLSGSSTFAKTSLNIWKFTVHVLLKPGLENFEHYFSSDLQIFVTLWTEPTRLLRPWDFSRQKYWSGMPLPSPDVLCI